MDIYALTRKGKNKNANEDRLLINKDIVSDGCFSIEGCKNTNNDVTVIAVADGVGGNNAGATASHFIVNLLSNLDNDDPEYVKSYIKSGNLELIKKSNANPDFYKMATTLSGLVIRNNNATLFHIGNTRIFVSANRYLKQITTDHTTVNYLLKTGKITAEEAADYDRRNEITACLGANDERLIDSLIVERVPNFENMSKIVMTSDGVHEHISLDDLENILEFDIPKKEKCEMIADKALQNGSTDDISVILAAKPA